MNLTTKCITQERVKMLR